MYVPSEIISLNQKDILAIKRISEHGNEKLA